MEEGAETGASGDFSSRFSRDERPPCQLYLISPPAIDSGFAQSLRTAAGEGGVAAFQLRLKGLDDHAIAKAAEPLQRVCADLDIAFIVNDSVALAKRLGADGVHLGQQDGEIADARQTLGRDAQIGKTCHNSRHLAMEAGESGADYVAFGAFFPSGTKDAAHRAETDILAWWTTLFGTPCVAIGGITAANALPLVEAGADFLAVSGAIWNAPEGPAAAVAAFRRLPGVA
jgi:thiamine-phosphate pyrophosphorylase